MGGMAPSPSLGAAPAGVSGHVKDLLYCHCVVRSILVSGKSIP